MHDFKWPIISTRTRTKDLLHWGVGCAPDVVEKHVLRLEVAKDNIERVQVAQGQGQLRGNEARLGQSGFETASQPASQPNEQAWCGRHKRARAQRPLTAVG